jgi:hypothetical protein
LLSQHRRARRDCPATEYPRSMSPSGRCDRPNGIGAVTTNAPPAIARSQISTPYWRETFRASGPSRKARETVTPKKMSRRVRYGARCDEMATSAMTPSIVFTASRLLEFACCQFRRHRPHGVGDYSRREPGRLSLGREFPHRSRPRNTPMLCLLPL